MTNTREKRRSSTREKRRSTRGRRGGELGRRGALATDNRVAPYLLGAPGGHRLRVFATADWH